MSPLLERRRAGILLHITSLPGTNGCGDLGKEAHNFVKFLRHAGITVWQTLPLGMTHGDGSPYQSLSAHAGNPALINIDWLMEKGWLQITERCWDCGSAEGSNKSCLVTKALFGFESLASDVDRKDFHQFCEAKKSWLEDFALFVALRNEFGQISWNQWPAPLKQRQVKAIADAKKRLAGAIKAIQFEQYVFFRQWTELKTVAWENGVLLFGDIPIFVSYDSADVWANPKVFKLNSQGEMDVVAGVPPDYFSQNGQRWGNPHYDWNYLKKTGFSWWLDRIESQYEMFDILRIDHFRGFEAAWEIPATEETAINGSWVQAPGHQLLEAIQESFPGLSLVAEDLGIITDEVEALRDDFDLPGMKILQFAFGDDSRNPYLPWNYPHNAVVYTGTHDNDTTLGWFNGLNDDERRRVYDCIGHSSESMPWALINAAFASVAKLAVIPLQDVLCLGSSDRMNTPGTTEGNWRWRFNWWQLTDEKVAILAHLVRLYGR